VTLTRYTLGGNSAAGGATTITFTLTHAVASGDALLVAISSDSGGDTFVSVTDSHSQTWTQVTTDTNQSDIIAVYRCLNSAAMTTSDTITGTFGGSTGSHAIVGVGCSGIATSSAVDISITNDSSGSSAPSSGTSAALAQASEYAAAFVVNGNGGGTPGSWTGGFTGQLTEHTTNHEWLTVADQVVTTKAALTAGASIASSKWAMVLVTLKAATSGSLTVTTTSPGAGQVGVAYTYQEAASGGVAPYTWDLSAGSVPTGLILEPGGGGGASGDFGYVGVNTGPQGAPTVAQFNACASTLGPFGYYKVFYSAGGSGIYTGYLGGDVNGGGTTGWTSGLEGQVTTSVDGGPGVFVVVCWGVLMSAAAISNYISNIPHNITEVGFSFQSEPENAYGLSAGAQFVADWHDQAQKIRACQAGTPVKLTLITSHFEGHYQDGTLTNSSFIPPASDVDVYGFDFYDRKNYWVGSDMSTNKAWTVWTGFVKGLGKPLALTEYGISGAGTDAAQNTRLQADLTYLKAAFGPGGSLSSFPLYCWLYWNTGGLSFALTDPVTGKPIINEMLGAGTQATWAGIAGTQIGSAAGTNTGGGGLLHGTPTTTSGSPFSFTVRATDSAGTTATSSQSITISASGSLSITLGSLPNGTTSIPYTTILTATGGTTPYTWSLNSGSLPSGLSISGQVITGTPTGTGTSSFVLKVTDAAAATQTASLSITIASALAVSTSSLPSGTAGTAYSTTLAAANGVTPYTWQLASGALPSGLSLDPATGILSGTPTTQGTYPVSFTVTDSAAASATSVIMTLAVSTSGGGLPALPRFVFGGGQADFGFQFSGTALVKAASVTWQFYTAKTGGSRYTDLEDMSNSPITSITTDSSGFAGEFQGPAGVLEMYADANGGSGPRYRITANNLGDSYTLLYAAVQGLVG
jgi:hypothetical protein